jgi:hypothetical protein
MRLAVVAALAALCACDAASPPAVTHYQAPPAPAPTCSVERVLIQSVEWRVELDSMRGVGQLVHSCPRAVGVELQVVGLTSANAPVASSRFWPASVQNIAAGQQYVFSLDHVLAADPRIAVLQVTPASVREW